MTSNNEYFDPEQVDEQIEHLHNTLQARTPEAHLVEALHQTYRVPLAQEDRAALGRARQRIQANLEDSEIPDLIPQLGNIGGPAPVPPTRRARLTRLLSGLAAVLVVGALLGSWLWVTHLAKPKVATNPTAQGTGLYTIHSGVAYRIDGRTGAVVWQQPVPTKKLVDYNHGGSATIRVANGVVYAMLDFDIYALDASSGKQLWHVLNNSNKEYFDIVVDSARVYLFSLDNTFSALSARTGAELWHNTTFTTENGYGFSVSDGTLFTPDSGTGISSQKLVALDAASGRMRWSHPLPDTSLQHSPLVANGITYFSSGSTLYAVNEQSGQEVWQKQLSSGDLSNMSYADAILYVSGNGPGWFSFSMSTEHIFALEAASGQLLWTSDAGYALFQVPITHGLLQSWWMDKSDYGISGMDTHTGKVVWRTPFGCNGTVANVESLKDIRPSCSAWWTQIVDGTLYVVETESLGKNAAPLPDTQYTLKSFNPATGKLLSSHPLGFDRYVPAIIGGRDGMLYVKLGVPRTANTISYFDTVLVAYSLKDGKEVWRHAMPPFPPPQGANTSPNTSMDIVLAP